MLEEKEEDPWKKMKRQLWEDEFGHLTKSPPEEHAKNLSNIIVDKTHPDYWEQRLERDRKEKMVPPTSPGFGLPFNKGAVLKTLGHVSKSWDEVADKTHYFVKNAGGALLGFATSSFDMMVAAGGAQVFISGRHALRETYNNYRDYMQEVEEAKAHRKGAGAKVWVHAKGILKTAMPTAKLAGKTAAMMFAAYAGNKAAPGCGGAIATIGVGALSSLRQNRIDRKGKLLDLNANAKNLWRENIYVVTSTVLANLAAKEEFISEKTVDLINTGSVTTATAIVLGAGICYAAKRIKANKNKGKNNKNTPVEESAHANSGNEGYEQQQPPMFDDESEIKEVNAEVVPANVFNAVISRKQRMGNSR